MRQDVEKRLSDLETIFKALAEGTRLRILALLLGGEVCVCHIHESLGVPQPTISRHLAYLRRAGLVEGRKEGLWVHYRLCEPHDEVLRTLLSSTTHCLRHLATTGRDRRKLERRTGSGLPASPRLPVLSCCSAPAGARRARPPG